MELYLLAYKLHIDIDIIREWDYDKVYKWLIALEKISEKTREESEKIQNTEEISSAINNGEKVIIRNSNY